MTQPQPRDCPALLVSALASGQGKTTVTAALARYHRLQGRRVRVFKTGPDFLDPMVLATACGSEVQQLDPFMGSPDQCRQLLWEAAGEADLILIEGMMGLFDGAPSSADLAQLFGIPVLAVVDVGGMAQTFAALAHGLASYRPEMPFAGVLANRVGSVGHARLLAESLSGSEGATQRWYGALPRDATIELPSRHLGLVQGGEIEDLVQRIDAAATALAELGETALPPPVRFDPPSSDSVIDPLLTGVRIGVARDAAFSFIYPANLQVLRDLGAELHFFSPLEDEHLPDVDSLYLPGGYPELHLPQLSANSSLIADVRAHHTAGRPILAECGGMLWLSEQLTGRDGETAPLCGILPARARMQARFTALGLQRLHLPLGETTEELRGHTFHHSSLETELEPVARGECPNGRSAAEAVYRLGRLTASYIHSYFPSNPAAIAALLTP